MQKPLRSENTDIKSVLVLGVGNLLLKDEGVGVHVVRRLEEMQLPLDVEVVDGGTGGADLLYYLEGRKKVIIIDAVKAHEAPGTIYRFGDENIEAMPKIFLSLHEFDLVDCLHLADFMGIKPENVVVIGIEPGDMNYGLELSPEIDRQIPKIIELVMKELKVN